MIRTKLILVLLSVSTVTLAVESNVYPTTISALSPNETVNSKSVPVIQSNSNLTNGCVDVPKSRRKIKKHKKNIKKAIIKSNTDKGFIDNININFSYSGDVSGVPEALRRFDNNIHIMQPTGARVDLPVNIDLQNVRLQDVIDAVNNQTSQQAQLIYSKPNNSLYLNYSGNISVGKDAIEESLKWQKGIAPKPVLGRDGIVRYPFGEYQPEITCEPRQICDIELQEGEEINGIAIGDSVNWNEGDNGVPVIYSGQSMKVTPHLVLKPNRGGLETSLMVTTSRRTYMIKLKSSLTSYVARTGFYYPGEMIQNYENKKQEFRDQTNGAISTASNSTQGIMVDLTKINDKYTIDGDNYSWKPTQVYDDGTHVYIQMPVGVSARELPGLCVFVDGDDTETKCQYLNWKYDNHVYIVDKLFNKAKLFNGYGDYEQDITITRDPDKKGFWARLFGG